MLPWFNNGKFPLYLAPMAGVTDRIFRSICKGLGADVMVTEFVSSEGIIRHDDRTRKYTEFDEIVELDRGRNSGRRKYDSDSLVRTWARFWISFWNYSSIYVIRKHS